MADKAIRVRTADGWQDIALQGPQGPPGADGASMVADSFIARACAGTSSGSATGYYLPIEGGNASPNGASVTSWRITPFTFNRARVLSLTPPGKKAQIVLKRWASINGFGGQNIVTMGCTTLVSGGGSGAKTWAIGTGVGGLPTPAVSLGTTPINTMTAPFEEVADLSAVPGFDGALWFYLYKNVAGGAGHIRDDFIEAWLRYADA